MGRLNWIETMTALSPALPFAFGLAAAYLYAAFLKRRKGAKWPAYRCLMWCMGTFAAAAAVAGPLAERAHADFTAHMAVHLLLGMLAPLLFAAAAPLTLLLGTLPVRAARRITRLLNTRYFRMVSHPLAASILQIAGLWLLYTTGLYAAMHRYALVHAAVHVHLLLAGYLFTGSLITFDPHPHRTGYLYRAAIFTAALTGHNILSKWVYAHPPHGVAPAQAEAGGMLMYYGGDAIHAVFITLFCLQWYKAAKPRTSAAGQAAKAEAL
jgi:putative membrane protein